MKRFLFEKTKRNTGAGEEAVNTKLHDTDLYDQDESVDGERRDLATGKEIDNSTYTGTEDLTEINETVLEGGVSDDDLAVLAKRVAHNPEAAAWLKEHKHLLK